MCEKCTPEENASVIRLWWEFAGILEPAETVSMARAMGVELEFTGTVQRHGGAIDTTGEQQCSDGSISLSDQWSALSRARCDSTR